MHNWIISYLPILFLILILVSRRKEKNSFIAARIRRRKGERQMEELAKRYIGRDVLLNIISGNAMDGILKEVVDNALVIEKDGRESFVNLDFVIRIREYPRNKNGKRKALILD